LADEERRHLIKVIRDKKTKIANIMHMT